MLVKDMNNFWSKVIADVVKKEMCTNIKQSGPDSCRIFTTQVNSLIDNLHSIANIGEFLFTAFRCFPTSLSMVSFEVTDD